MDYTLLNALEYLNRDLGTLKKGFLRASGMFLVVFEPSRGASNTKGRFKVVFDLFFTYSLICRYMWDEFKLPNHLKGPSMDIK